MEVGEDCVGMASSEFWRIVGLPCRRRAVSMASLVSMEESGYSFLYDSTPGAAWSSFGGGSGA